MPPSIASLTSRWGADTGALRFFWRAGPIAIVHLAALIILLRTEYYDVPRVGAFLLTWGLLNFVWLAVLRRPGVSAVMSLAMVAILIQVSQLKYKVIWQTVNFVDLMVIDPSSFRYLLAIFPGLSTYVMTGVTIFAAVVILLWRLDPFRMRRLSAIAGAVACLLGLGGLSVTHPFWPEDIWLPHSHVSNFSRSGIDAVIAYTRVGYMESDLMVTDRLKTIPAMTCEPTGKPPHIIMVHDESAFDIRNAPNIQVPQGYGRHFRSFDGKQRDLVVEAAGGPSWYTEYNVFAGLSARSFGKFSYFVTRIAAGRVERGLPNSLRRCGYRTFSLYPANGAFMGARAFQASTGVQNFFDRAAMRSREVEPDSFYYDTAINMLEREREKGPTFFFIYLSANHFPWDHRWRPELTAGWRDLGNRPVVDEYLRRQTLGMREYQQFLERLRRQFPGERFMLVRYGDHQPDFATQILEPSAKDDAIVRSLMANDPKYYTTYYAIDAINYRPVNISSALDSIEAPYLPLVVLESAGLPLDPSFAEQKKIFERCKGLFYSCAHGAEARRFNRLLIDAGLIKGLRFWLLIPALVHNGRACALSGCVMTFANFAGEMPTVVPISRLELIYSQEPWPFSVERRADIDAHFERVRIARSGIWNGLVLVMHRHRLEGDALEGEFLQTDFASFLAWRDWGFPDAGITNCFSMGALRSSDGAWLMGVMASHTAAAGKIYFPAGTPDPGDIVDGEVDLAGSVTREVAEETGLGPGDFTETSGWHGVIDGPRIALMKVLQAHEPEALRARILDYLAREAEPELADIRIVRSARDFDPMMPRFVTAFLDHTGFSGLTRS